MPSSVAPWGCGPYGSSTTVARMCETPRTLAARLYQASVRSQYDGSVFVASWMRSKTFIVPDWTTVLPEERVPRMVVRNDHEGSLSIAEPMPTKPPPLRKYASNTARWESVSGLAMPVL